MNKHTIPDELFDEMAQLLSQDELNEMALPSYSHPNPFIRWMAWKRVQTMTRLLQKWACSRLTTNPYRQIMDFGCGSGVLLKPISEFYECVYGVDIVLAPSKLLITRFGLEKVTLLSPEQANSIKNASLDVIVCGEVLEHMTDLTHTLTLFKSKLKPDGMLLVSLPMENTFYRLGRRLAGFSGHYHLKKSKVLVDEIELMGFRKNWSCKIPLPDPFSVYWIIEYQMKS